MQLRVNVLFRHGAVAAVTVLLDRLSPSVLEYSDRDTVSK